VQVLKRSSKTTSVNIGTTISLRAGNNMIIKCPVTEYGQVNIYWMKDKKIFKGSRVHDDGSVYMRKVKLGDSGDYECYSRDEARQKFGAVTLKVIGTYQRSYLVGQKGRQNLLVTCTELIHYFTG